MSGREGGCEVSGGRRIGGGEKRTHIFVLVNCIEILLEVFDDFIVVRSYATEEIMYSYNQLKLQNFLS